MNSFFLFFFLVSKMKNKFIAYDSEQNEEEKQLVECVNIFDR